ncbi:hypothetical protein D3C87_1067900 [compost metagenome]
MQLKEELFIDDINVLITRYKAASSAEKQFIREFYYKILKSKKQRKLFDIRKLLNTIDILNILDGIESKLAFQRNTDSEKLFIEITGNVIYTECNHLRNKLFEIEDILNTMPLTINATHDNLLRGCTYSITTERFFKKYRK